MIKLTSKVVGIISGSSAAVIGGTTVTANVLLRNEIGKEETINPLDRDKTYHHYSIINKISKNEKLDNIISVQKSDTSITYVIEEKRFVENIKNIVQEALKTIPAFSQDYLNYTIVCNYKINTKSVLVDLVWYKPNDKNKFFDQFELLLQTN